MPRTKAEIGAVGLPIFAGYVQLDPNKNLRGVAAVKVYREMALDDPAIASFLAAGRYLLRTDFGVEVGGSTDNDKRAAAFLEQCIDDMRVAAARRLRQLYSAQWCGWSLHEIIYKRRSGGKGSKYTDGKIGWADWALRRQESLYRWTYDIPTGRVTALQQRPAPTYDLRIIPLTKAIHIVADETDGSPEGVSPLRGAYRNWYFVKNFELLHGIALERFGTGLPVFEIDAPAGTALTEDDLARLDAIGSAIQQNESAYLTLPAAVKFHFAESPGLNSNDYITAIDRYRNWMLVSVLADFIALGLGDRGGAYALGKDKSELFLMALNGFQNIVLDALNEQAVARLFAYNDFGKLTDLPRLSLPAVKRYDLEALGNFAQKLEQIGMFHPTPEDEEFARKISDLPDVDPATLQAYYDADEQERDMLDLPETTADDQTQSGATAPDMQPGDDSADVAVDDGAALSSNATVDQLITGQYGPARRWAKQVMKNG